jgi:glucosamine--fructose-6-phosphate aminotransferase (isomerizing)
MCGIISIITNNNNIDIQNILINGLIQLQNRGYDSAGIASLDSNNEIQLLKYASTEEEDSIDKIKSNLKKIEKSNIMIGHTRWATHGQKNDTNSHPHLSYDNKFAIVHNGIIENYFELKLFLEKKNIFSKSETDTEIIVNLLSYFYNNEEDINKAIKTTLSLIEGTYALIILSKDNPDKLYCIRKGSPLLIGKNNDYIIIASEKSAFQKLIDNYFYLENNDIVIISKDLNINTNNKYKLFELINEKIDLTYKPYSCWLEKEIFEQYESSKRALSFKGRLFDDYIKLGGLEQNKEFLMSIKNIIILGCGTSYNAGYLSKFYFQELCNFNTIQIINASQFTDKDIPYYGSTAILFLSQSGETRDLYNCIEIANKKNCFKIGIINSVDSLISKEMDCGCYLNAGREVSIASTKSYINQVIVLNLVALWFSQLHYINQFIRLHYIKDLHQISELIHKTLEMDISLLYNTIKNLQSNLFILGKGKYYPVAKECSLKIKEICYIHSEAFESSELKHGPYSLLNNESVVILFITKDEYYDKMISTYEQIQSRNSKFIIITNIVNTKLPNTIIVPFLKYIQELLFIIPIQLACLKIAQYKNINPDKLKNLAKCVTTD